MLIQTEINPAVVAHTAPADEPYTGPQSSTYLRVVQVRNSECPGWVQTFGLCPRTLAWVLYTGGEDKVPARVWGFNAPKRLVTAISRATWPTRFL